jgi:hypothetical protein
MHSYQHAQDNMGFFKIPVSEEELHKVCFFWNMEKCERVDEIITVDHIKAQTLKLIYEDNTEEAMKLVEDNFIKKKWANEFQFDLLMAFWLSVHCENVELVRRLMDYDVYLRWLVTLSLDNRAEKPHRFKPKQDEP